MLKLVPNKPKPASLSETIGTHVSAAIFEALSSEEGALYDFDRWTRRKLTLQNLAKMELVLSADDPLEYCYQNLVREIDVEAEFGIYLVKDTAIAPDLKSLLDEPGISGEMHARIAQTARKLYRAGVVETPNEPDLVWETILKRYARARVDTAVSEIMIGFLMDSAEAAEYMSHAIRALMYSFHEDNTRRECGLPPQLRDRETRELTLMVTEHRRRAGDYSARVREIAAQAGTA